MKKMQISWFWLAFIFVILIGAITSIIMGDSGIFESATLLALLMGIGKFLS